MPSLKEFSKKLSMSIERATEILQTLYGFNSLTEELSDEMSETLIDIDEDENKFNELLKKKQEEEEKKKKESKSTKKKKKEEKIEGEEEKRKKETRSKTKKEKKGTEILEAEETITKGEEEKKKRVSKKKLEKTEEKEVETIDEAKTKTKKKKTIKEISGESETITLRGKEENEYLSEKTKIDEQFVKEAKLETAETKEHGPGAITERKSIHIAEIVPEEEVSRKPSGDDTKKKKKNKEQSIGINIGSAIEEAEPVVEIVLSDGRRARIDDENFDERLLITQPTEEEVIEEDELLEEEYEDEHDWRRKHKKVLKHPPVPDPDVVAKVKKESEERLKKKKEKDKGKSVVVIDKEKLFGRREEKKGKFDKKDKKKGKLNRYEVDMDDETMLKEAAAAVKEFETFGSSLHLKKKKRRKDKTTHFDDSMEKVEIPVIEVSGPMTVENVAQLLEVSPSDIIMDLMDLNIMATKNQLIDLETIRFVAKKYGVEVQLVIPEEEEVLSEEPDHPEDLVPRAPVVTVMGHVDHGKTSLLDRVRKTNVVATESGGITQHIAAYEVQTTSGKVVFLDTPGHEAFTQMRARGAKITDIVVLVVAADDGVQPQTIEAIDHAKAAEVPIIVAINKCDKPDAQPDRVRQELIAYDLVDEAWGGKTIMKNISAKTGEGVNELLELIILQSQMMELKANPKKRAKGSVIEAEISRGFGPVAWVLVQNGTLKVGDVCLVGNTWGKIRAMFNSQEEPIREAPPSTPVLISGLESLPEAGDTLVVVEDERKARLIAEKREEIKKFQTGETAKVITLEDFHSLVETGEQKKLNILIKADVQGSADVLKSSLSGLGNEEVGVEIIRSSVGEVNESDILLAQVCKAIIVTFHVGVNPRAQKLAEETGVEIRKYEVIYEIIEDVRKALSGLLKPIVNEVVIGHAEIRKVFRSSIYGNIAGCFQLDGITIRGALARVVRQGNIICEDKIASLKRNKDDVREVSAGFECGIKLEKFEDIMEGDVIEVYRIEEVKPSLN